MARASLEGIERPSSRKVKAATHAQQLTRNLLQLPAVYTARMHATKMHLNTYTLAKCMRDVQPGCTTILLPPPPNTHTQTYTCTTAATPASDHCWVSCTVSCTLSRILYPVY